MQALETRTCKCECKRTWRCLPTSTSEYYSWYECAKKTPNDGRLEFTGATDYAVRNARRRERLQSRWDKKKA